MIQLRQDQTDAVQELRGALAKHQSVIMRGECGWGKTVVSAHMAAGAQQKRRHVIFGVHRRELARQTAKTFERFNIRYGYIAAGMKSDPFALVQIASHGTLMRRPELMRADLFVPDEAHLWANGLRAEMIHLMRAQGAHIVPLTATPEQGSGVGLMGIADHIVHGPSVSWLMERGLLAKYKAYAPISPDMAGLHTRGGDYIVGELEDRFSKPAIYGDQVAAYKKFAYRKRAIGYSYSRKHGEEMAATFRAAGIPSAFIDGETPDHIRIATIEAFAAGDIWVLFNCALFREGFDLSAQVGREVPIQCVLLCAPTQSLPLAIQMMMRAMRRQEGFAILLDFVNLFKTHGFPDDERDWTLEGIPPKVRHAEGAIFTQKCEFCFGTFRQRFSKCPECQTEISRGEGRTVEVAAGEIDEIDVEAVRRMRKAEIHKARTLPALAALAIARGYRPGWIVNIMKARGETVTVAKARQAMEDAA